MIGEGAYANLKDFKDIYPTRRNKEAAFLGPQIFPIPKPTIEARAEGGPVFCWSAISCW